jgi:hypothetical protein
MTVQNHLNSRSSYRTKSYAPYYTQAKAQLMPFEEKNLALLLTTDEKTLQEKRATLKAERF